MEATIIISPRNAAADRGHPRDRRKDPGTYRAAELVSVAFVIQEDLGITTEQE